MQTTLFRKSAFLVAWLMLLPALLHANDKSIAPLRQEKLSPQEVLRADAAAAERLRIDSSSANIAKAVATTVDLKKAAIEEMSGIAKPSAKPLPLPRKSKTNSPGKLVEGYLIAKDYVHGGSEVNCAMGLQKLSADTVEITNFYGLGENIKAGIDLASGKITIKPQVAYIHKSYGPAYIFPIAFKPEGIEFYPSSELQGTIDDKGVIRVGPWAIIVGGGNYAGTMLVAVDKGEYFPSNATMSGTRRSQGEDVAMSYPLLLEQTDPAELTIYNFATTGIPAKARLSADGTISISPQTLYNMAIFGAFNCCAADAKTNSYTITDPVTGKVTGNTAKLNAWALASVMQSGTVALFVPECSISSTMDIRLPEKITADFEGDGTASSPWLIVSARDLVALSQMAETNSFQNKYFKQTADIDMSANGVFMPIGNSKAAFNGNYDGNGKTISNLTINGIAYNFQGLFGAVFNNATIKNLNLRNAKITGNGTYLAPLAGYSMGTIENCHADGLVQTEGVNVGGLVGRSYGAMRNCSFSGKVYGAGYVGGVVGYSFGELTNCVSDAFVAMPTRLTDPVACVGGVVGLAQSQSLDREGIITDCRFSGTVENGSGYGFAGGVSGYVYYADYARNANVGRVMSTYPYSSEDVAGGLTGIARDCKINDCLNAGLVSTAGTSLSTGGLIGYISTAYSTIGGMLEKIDVSNCVNTGQVLGRNVTDHAGIFGNEFTSTITPDKPSDSGFKNCLTDNQATGLDDARFGTTTASLAGKVPQSFSASTWVASTGLYPVLKNLDGTEVKRLAAAAVNFKEGESTRVMKSAATLSNASGISWKLLKGGKLGNASEGLTINGNNVVIGNVYANDTIMASGGNGLTGRAFVVNVVPKIFEGDGTEQNPYLIKTKADFIALHDAVMHFDHRGDFFRQTADVDFGLGDDFSGVGAGNHLKEFAGVFDGDNHKVKGLKIKSIYYDANGRIADGSYNYGGLFHIGAATSEIRNVVIDSDCQFNFYRQAAPVIGYTLGKVTNCRNYADVAEGSGNIGGVVGYADAGAVVAGCYNAGRITNSGDFTGGIVGQNLATVLKSQNDGEIAASGRFAGGVVGASSGSVKYCVNSAAVAASDYAGGVIGSNSAETGGGDVIGTLSSGQVKTSGEYKGGVVGYSNGRKTAENNYFDNSVNGMDGCSSLSQGFTGLATAELLNPSGLAGLSSEDFTFSATAYPSLKAFVAEVPGVACRSIFINFAKGEKSSNVLHATALSSDSRIKWTLAGNESFTLADSKLNITMPEGKVASDTLTASIDDKYIKVFPLRAIPTILEGLGSKDAPFQIKSADDMNLLADFMASSLMDYEGYYFQVMNDINYGETPFKPVALTGVQFQGTFLGDGKTIAGINFTDETSKTGKNIGLFGTVGSKGTIRDLTVEGNIKAYSYAGGFAGLLYGKILNCESKISLDAKSSYSAGFAGRMYDGAEIRNSVFSGVTMPSYQTNSNYHGGFAGQVDQGALIDSCVNKGTVGNLAKNTSGTTFTGQQYVGGIAGINSGIISNCRNEGKVQGKMHLGGIAGRVGKTGCFYDCANLTDILTEGGSYVGGIAPQTQGSGLSEIIRCYNTGNLKGKGYVGGIIGAITQGMTLSDCYNTGTITAFSSTGYGAGGVVGQAQSNATYPTVITRCYNTGDVFSEANSAGGFAGKIATVPVSDCYNVGNVTVAKETEAAADNGVGGFAGSFCGTAERIWNAGNVVSNIPGAGGLVGTGAMPIAKITKAANFGNVTVSRTTEDKGYGAAGIWGGYGPADLEECYNFGTITAPDVVAGINSGLWSNGNGGSTITACYNAGKVVATAQEPKLASNVTFVSTAKGVDSTLMAVTKVYFDTDSCAKLGIEKFGKGLTRKELMKADLGESFLHRTACLPTLEFLDSVPVANFHAAHILLAEGDDPEGLMHEFNVGLMPMVIWSSSSNLEINSDGTVALKEIGKGWVKVVPDDALSSLEKSFYVTSKVSGIDSITESMEIESVEYYTLKGVRTSVPAAGEIYIVKTLYKDGHCTVAKKFAR